MLRSAVLAAYVVGAGGIGAVLLWRIGLPDSFGHLMSGIIFGGLLELAWWYGTATADQRKALREGTKDREPGNW